MLTVIKRSGKEELFNVEKVRKTLIAASEEIKQPLNESDIKIITESVTYRLSGKERVTSKEVYEVLVESMRYRGFHHIADAYIHFADNYWI